MTAPATVANAFLDAALSYAARGWRVFPCRPQAKEPLTANGFKDASTDPAQIRGWWAQHPDANIAIANGRDFLIVDVDGPAGEQSLRDLVPELPATPSVATSHGRHLYFAYPRDRIVGRKIRVREELDVLGDGGYVLAPPSVHPSGAIYRWLSAGELAIAPEALFAVSRPRASAIVEGGPIAAGQRNAVLTSLAGVMRRRGMTGHGILAALAAENAARCDPPLDQRELEAIAHSVARYDPAARTVTSRSFDTITEEAVRWLWPGVMPYGKLTLVIGDPGHGKSFLTLDLAARISAGLPLPDGTATAAADVQLVFCEDGAADTVRPRLRVHGADLARVHEIQVTDGGVERLLALDTDIAALEAEIATSGARLVIFDPLNAYLGSRVNSWKDDDVRQLLAGVAKLAERTGCAVVAILHLNKKQVTNALQRATGSGAFVAVARSVFLVGAHPEDNDLPLKDQRRIFASAKPNLAGPVPSRSFRIHESEDKIGRFVWEGETSASARDVMVAELGGSGQDGKLEHAVEWLKAALASGPQQAAGLHDRAEAAGISHKTLQRASKLLDVVKQQEATAGKQFWTWHLPDTPKPLAY